MLADFYITRLLNDMKIAVQKKHLGGQILYGSLVPFKWYEALLSKNFDPPKKTASRNLKPAFPKNGRVFHSVHWRSRLIVNWVYITQKSINIVSLPTFFDGWLWISRNHMVCLNINLCEVNITPKTKRPRA